MASATWTQSRSKDCWDFTEPTVTYVDNGNGTAKVTIKIYARRIDSTKPFYGRTTSVSSNSLTQDSFTPYNLSHNIVTSSEWSKNNAIEHVATLVVTGTPNSSGKISCTIKIYGVAVSYGYGNRDCTMTISALNGITVTSKYTLTYNANGGTGTTASQSVLKGNNVTLNANSFTAPPASSPVHTIYLKDENGNPSVNGIATCYENKFYRWGLNSATGTSYQPGASYGPVNSNTVFYAKWSTNYQLGSSTKSSTESQGYQVIFDASTNGGSCSTVVLNSKIYTHYDFAGWLNSDKTKTYPVGSKVGGPTAYTYYESWTSRTENGSIQLPVATKTNPSSISITIYLNANGGTCSITSMQSSATLTYNFDGWYNEDTRVGGANDNFVPNQATTLIARFTTITGSFNKIILPTPYRQGYEFLGWSIDENATSGIIGKYDPSGEETLYAIWKPKGTVRISIDGDMTKKAQAYIFHDGAWHLTQPQTSYNNNWKINGG